MLKRELDARARVVVLPSPGGRVPSIVRGGVTVRDGVRHVMEELPSDQRQRAVVQTPVRLMFFSEIKAVYETLPSGSGPRAAKPFPSRSAA